MKEVYYIYNNEAIASCILFSVLQKVESLDFAMSCLILPFLFDDQTVNHLSNIKNTTIDLENIIQERPRLFASFNKRYLALLPITINALMILKKSNQIKISNSIYANLNKLSTDSDLGERYHKISEVIPTFLQMIERYTTLQLYQILNIQL